VCAHKPPLSRTREDISRHPDHIQAQFLVQYDGRQAAHAQHAWETKPWTTALRAWSTRRTQNCNKNDAHHAHGSSAAPQLTIVASQAVKTLYLPHTVVSTWVHVVSLLPHARSTNRAGCPRFSSHARCIAGMQRAQLERLARQNRRACCLTCLHTCGTASVAIRGCRVSLFTHAGDHVGGTTAQQTKYPRCTRWEALVLRINEASVLGPTPTKVSTALASTIGPHPHTKTSVNTTGRHPAPRVRWSLELCRLFAVTQHCKPSTWCREHHINSMVDI